MKRLTALGAAAAVTVLAGCATGDGYYGGEYGYDGYGYGGYPAYAYNDYGYVPYYDDFGYPYAYGPSFGLGFGYYDYGGWGGNRGRADLRRWDGNRTGRNWSGNRGGSGRPSSPPAGGLGPQAVGPQGAPSGTAVAPSSGSGGSRSGFMGRRRS